MMTWLLLLVASGLGATTRFAFERRWNQSLSASFPTGTLVANLLGSFILGFVVGMDFSTTVTQTAAGFCAAFTTFGGFIGQGYAMQCDEASKYRGYLYVAGTAIMSIAAAFLGFWFGR